MKRTVLYCTVLYCTVLYARNYNVKIEGNAKFCIVLIFKRLIDRLATKAKKINIRILPELYGLEAKKINIRILPELYGLEAPCKSIQLCLIITYPF